MVKGCENMLKACKTLDKVLVLCYKKKIGFAKQTLLGQVFYFKELPPSL